MKKRIYLSPPHLIGNEQKLVDEAFTSNWIAPTGPFIDSFEVAIAKYLDTGFGCALSSGTAALHLALEILGIDSGDKVLCPSLTFAASANVILYKKAIPIFLDVNESDWTIDINLLEKAIKKYKPKALITVDLYGQSCDYSTIIDICKKYRVLVIEDAAEALGSSYKNKKCGSFGDISILSFNGNKIITSSGGGMLLSKKEEYVEKARFLASQARENEVHYEHKELGYNYRMSNILAAIGLGQLQNIELFVRKKRRIFNKYKDALGNIEGFTFMPESKHNRMNRWLTTISINKKITGFGRNDIIKALEKENIESRPVWKPMHLQPLYITYKYLFTNNDDVSKRLFNNGICLPSGVSLTQNDQDTILNIILSLFD